MLFAAEIKQKQEKLLKKIIRLWELKYRYAEFICIISLSYGINLWTGFESKDSDPSLVNLSKIIFIILLLIFSLCMFEIYSTIKKNYEISTLMTSAKTKWFRRAIKIHIWLLLFLGILKIIPFFI